MGVWRLPAWTTRKQPPTYSRGRHATKRAKVDPTSSREGRLEGNGRFLLGRARELSDCGRCPNLHRLLRHVPGAAVERGAEMAEPGVCRLSDIFFLSCRGVEAGWRDMRLSPRPARVYEQD